MIEIWGDRKNNLDAHTGPLKIPPKRGENGIFAFNFSGFFQEVNPKLDYYTAYKTALVNPIFLGLGLLRSSGNGLL